MFAEEDAFGPIGKGLDEVAAGDFADEVRARNAEVTDLDSPSRFVVETNQLGPDILEILGWQQVPNGYVVPAGKGDGDAARIWAAV